EPPRNAAPFVLCLVLDGRCRALPHDGGPVVLGPGELGAFPRGVHRVDVDDGGCADLLRADLACDEWVVRTLFACLPTHVVLPLQMIDAAAWIEASLRHGVAQAKADVPGRPSAMARLAEALLAEVLPLCMQQQGAARLGWLAAAGDRIVGQVLAAMQRNPDREWTVDALAREAGTSRSVLSERFQQRMGTSPMQYLSQLRLALAANLLATSEVPLVRIAEDVGYQTDTAFSRAFRRHYGVPPATWRRRHAATRGALDSFAG
ncbi:MAG: helix-turn-helix domain-containing protein, partial [Ramlibacter sp.]